MYLDSHSAHPRSCELYEEERTNHRSVWGATFLLGTRYSRISLVRCSLFDAIVAVVDAS